MGLVVWFMLSCSGLQVAKEFVNRLEDLNEEAAAEWEEGRPEREREVEAYLAKYELEVMKPEEIKRILFQEWLDHRQRAWVPVAVVSELALTWPKTARAERITITQHVVTIQATNNAGAQALKDALERAQWVKDVNLSESVVTGQVVAVKRVLAPASDPELLAEMDRLSNGEEGLQFSSSVPLPDMNDPGYIDRETDAFNCWRRVMKMSEGFKTLDGEWVEGGMKPVRPDKPTIPVGPWIALPEKEEGKAWVRNRASKELSGPFSALVQGLDCTKSTSVQHGVRKIDFQPDPSMTGNAILVYEIDLFLEITFDANRETPWSQSDFWGEADRPERVRVLKDKTLANPFAG